MTSTLHAVLGRLLAIETTLQLLITSHPQDDELRALLRRELTKARDFGLFSDVPEDTLEGWDTAVRRFLPAGDDSQPPNPS